MGRSARNWEGVGAFESLDTLKAQSQSRQMFWGQSTAGVKARPGQHGVGRLGWCVEGPRGSWAGSRQEPAAPEGGSWIAWGAMGSSGGRWSRG